MRISLSENDLSRLVLTKMMYMHGLYHASLRDQMSRTLSILHFDSANEIVLRLLADKSGDRYNEDSFGSYLASARKVVSGTKALPSESEITELHKVRNRVQHGALTVDASTVDRFKKSTERFLSTVIHCTFGKTVIDISLAELIHDAELRNLIKKAELDLDRRMFRKSIETSEEVLKEATFEHVFGKAGSLTGYMGANVFKKMIARAEYVKPFRGQTKKLASDVSEAIVKLGRIVTSMQFLDNYRGDFIRHRERIDNLEKLSGSELKEGAASSLDFVTNLVIKWQLEGILG
jgi:hypothetical protein